MVRFFDFAGRKPVVVYMYIRRGTRLIAPDMRTTGVRWFRQNSTKALQRRGLFRLLHVSVRTAK